MCSITHSFTLEEPRNFERSLEAAPDKDNLHIAFPLVLFWTCHGLGRCPQCRTIMPAQKCVPNALMSRSSSMRISSRAHANLSLLTTSSSSPLPYHSITLRHSSLPPVTRTLAWPLKSSPARVHIPQRNSAGPSASAAWCIRVHRGGSAAYGCSMRSDWRWSTAFAVINAASARLRWESPAGGWASKGDTGAQ